jgi:hypothetical protein
MHRARFIALRGLGPPAERVSMMTYTPKGGRRCISVVVFCF